MLAKVLFFLILLNVLIGGVKITAVTLGTFKAQGEYENWMMFTRSVSRMSTKPVLQALDELSSQDSILREKYLKPEPREHHGATPEIQYMFSGNGTFHAVITQEIDEGLSTKTLDWQRNYRRDRSSIFSSVWMISEPWYLQLHHPVENGPSEALEKIICKKLCLRGPQ